MVEGQKSRAKRVFAEEGSSGRITPCFDCGRYRDHGYRWDDNMLRAAVLERRESEGRFLDLGAGAGIVPEFWLRRRRSHTVRQHELLLGVDHRDLDRSSAITAKLARALQGS